MAERSRSSRLSTPQQIANTVVTGVAVALLRGRDMQTLRRISA
jgi:hypothetical protein